MNGAVNPSVPGFRFISAFDLSPIVAVCSEQGGNTQMLLTEAKRIPSNMNKVKQTLLAFTVFTCLFPTAHPAPRVESLDICT